MIKQIYRGYDVTNEPAPGDMFPVKVYENAIKIWAGKTEDEAMAFIDRTKRELAAARKS